MNELLGDILADSLRIDACFADFPTIEDYRNAIQTILMSEHSLDEATFITAVVSPPEAAAIADIASRVEYEGSGEKEAAFYGIADWLALTLSERSLNFDESYTNFFLTQQYGRLKNTYGAYDYADLIARALALVTDSESAAWVLYKLDQRLEHLLLDEAQDTSAPQWSIVAQLTADFFSGDSVTEKDPSLFVVGDFKQSIYSFQGANPALFQENEVYYAETVTNAQKSWARVPLDVSFRSSQPILDFVDSVFGTESAQTALGVTMPLKHTAHRHNQAGHIALLPLATGTPAETPLWPMPLERTEQTDAEEVLAQQLGNIISDWLETGRILPSRNRPIEPRDILLLVRTRSTLSHRVIAALKKRGIPIAGADRFSLKNHLAVQDLLALGNFLLLPEDAYSLACVLKSPLFNISEQTLFELCYQRQESLWHVVRERSLFGETLSKWLGLVDFLTPSQLYGHILQTARPAFRARFGEEVNDVLEEFTNVLFTFEEQHIPTLQGFLHWADNAPLTVKREQGTAFANEVRLMTTHGAKGLQAPIVFLLDANSTPRARERLVWANTLFIAPQGATVLPETLSGLKEERAAEIRAEYYRLLYVALTRAEDALYIAGTTSSRKEAVTSGSWYELAANVFANSPLTQRHRDGTLYWDTAGTAAPDRVEKTTANADNTTPLPAWALQTVPLETPRTALTPRLEEPPVSVYGMNATTANAARERGIVLHSYLQKLPLVPPQERAVYLPETLNAGDKAMLLALLAHPDLKDVFANERLTEVPVRAVLDGKLYQGQIDCLVIGKDKILLVDYKSTLNPPTTLEDVPKSYIQQLALYAASVRALYPQHLLECALLWTATGKLMRVPQ
jgi:ATP-dependent helicase/nuclease subunit A